MALERLVDRPEEALQSWPAIPMLHREEAQTLQTLFEIPELSRLTGSEVLRPRNTVLVRNGELVPRSNFVRDGQLVPHSVQRHIRDGYTLSLRAMHEFFPAIGRFCEQLRKELGHPVQANGYITPPGAQGFRHHWDTHITVAVQLFGAKRWDLYEPLIADPIYPHHAFPEIGFTAEQRGILETAEPSQSAILEPGDVLWLPRGWIHNPSAVAEEPSTSAHITFGIIQHTHFTLAETLLTEAAADGWLRQALPPGPSPQLSVDTMRRFRRHLIRILETVDVRQARMRADRWLAQ